MNRLANYVEKGRGQFSELKAGKLGRYAVVAALGGILAACGGGESQTIEQTPTPRPAIEATPVGLEIDENGLVITESGERLQLFCPQDSADDFECAN